MGWLCPRSCAPRRLPLRTKTSKSSNTRCERPSLPLPPRPLKTPIRLPHSYPVLPVASALTSSPFSPSSLPLGRQAIRRRAGRQSRGGVARQQGCSFAQRNQAAPRDEAQRDGGGQGGGQGGRRSAALRASPLRRGAQVGLPSPRCLSQPAAFRFERVALTLNRARNLNPRGFSPNELFLWRVFAGALLSEPRQRCPG